MTEAGWTREKPIAAGWYWWRSLNGMIGPEIIQIDNTNGPDTDLEVIGPFGETPLDEWIAESEDEPGEWQGPLSPDSYHQGRVAGLREAAEMVEDDCYIEGGELLPDYKHRCKHNVNQKELAGKIRFRANDLAQQAQEGGVGDGN